MNDKYSKILGKIKSNYKNTDFLIDIYLENYHNNYIYARIDYYKKLGEYRLSWLNLATYNNKFDSVISYEYVPKEAIDHLIKVAEKIKYDKQDNSDIAENKITINSKLLGSDKTIILNRYVPKEDTFLGEIVNVIFDFLPRRLYLICGEILATFTGTTGKYEYQDVKKFDLLNDKLDNIFSKEIITLGEKYYNDGRVFFLEKIGEFYYSVVGGTNLYVVKIKYDDEKKLMQVYCSCPCEFYCKHICAVILAIRNKKKHPFFKITNQSDDIPLLDIIMNFQFLLCIGIDDQNQNYLIIEDDMIKVLPIIENGKSNWRILEDDNKGTLTKRMKDIIKD